MHGPMVTTQSGAVQSMQASVNERYFAVAPTPVVAVGAAAVSTGAGSGGRHPGSVANTQVAPVASAVVQVSGNPAKAMNVSEFIGEINKRVGK